MRWLRKLGADLSEGRNLEVYLTILVALVLFVLDVLGVVQPEAIAAGTLATLALLAYSTINNREQVDLARDETQKLTQLLEDRVLGSVRAEDFFTNSRPNHNGELSSAHTIKMVGVTLSRTVRDYLGCFQQRLSEGATIQLITIDPESEATKQAALRSYQVAEPSFYPDRLKPTMDLLRVLVALPSLTGSFSLRLIPFAPSFGMVMIDPEQQNGKIYVEIYQHHSFDPNPTFVLERERDAYWYDFFKQQFELLSRSARAAEEFQVNVQEEADN